jgi:hypothetical protein
MTESIAGAQAAIDEAVDAGVLPDDDATIRVWERMARQGQPVVFALSLMGARQGVAISAAASYDDDEGTELDPEFRGLYPPKDAREARRRRTRIEASAQVRRDHADDEDDWKTLYPPSERFRP